VRVCGAGKELCSRNQPGRWEEICPGLQWTDLGAGAGHLRATTRPLRLSSIERWIGCELIGLMGVWKSNDRRGALARHAHLPLQSGRTLCCADARAIAVDYVEKWDALVAPAGGTDSGVDVMVAFRETGAEFEETLACASAALRLSAPVSVFASATMAWRCMRATVALRRLRAHKALRSLAADKTETTEACVAVSWKPSRYTRRPIGRAGAHAAEETPAVEVRDVGSTLCGCA